MMASFYLCVFCGLLMIVVSKVYPEPLKPEARALVWDNWREPLLGKVEGRGMGNYRVASAVVVATFIALYVIFR